MNNSTDFIGKYENLFLGYSTSQDIRDRGSSGGIGTSILIHLLTSEFVDGVISVGFDSLKPYVPKYCLAETSEEIKNLSGSKYSFIEFIELENLLKINKNKKIAVVVQPCYVKILRKWQQDKYPNIKFILSFFCGYNMTTDATDYIIKKSGIETNQIKEIDYRGGEYPGGFQIKTNSSIKSYGKESYEILNLMFLRNGCRKCKLYMGEDADIAVGDAWIKEHPKLTAIVCRSSIGLQKMIEVYETKAVNLYELTEENLLKMHLHNLKYKKIGHSKLMNFVVDFFNKKIPHNFIPFYLFSKLSKIRRKFKIGISVPKLTVVERNKT